MAGGRPSLKTPEMVAEICRRLSEGETLSSICRDEAMPNFSTVYRWEQEDDEFRKVSARAREVGCDALAEECIAIADEKDVDPATKRVRVDTRIRLIGKWNAKRYGDKLDHNHTGSLNVTLASVLAGIGQGDDPSLEA